MDADTPNPAAVGRNLLFRQCRARKPVHTLETEPLTGELQGDSAKRRGGFATLKCVEWLRVDVRLTRSSWEPQLLAILC